MSLLLARLSGGGTTTVTPSLYTVTLTYHAQTAIVRGARVMQGLYTVVLSYPAVTIRGGARVVQALYTVTVSYLTATIFTPSGAGNDMGHTRKKRRTQ